MGASQSQRQICALRQGVPLILIPVRERRAPSMLLRSVELNHTLNAEVSQ
jgi:hypothetical protein